MPISFHNTLTGKIEPFVPLKEKEVKLYVCGITPYDESHLGHGRCYVTFDAIRRYLEFSGFHVTHIQNFTDVDDKIIARAKETGVAPEVLSKTHAESYFRWMEKLNVLKAHQYPLVTGHIPDITRLVERLSQNGHAYALKGDVYYSVRSFSGYGKLSKRSLDDLRAGARVEVNEQKKDPMDFALWKSAKEGEPAWDSPWGKGRPGWHIECSAMSMKYLGESFDIHGGGLDLIFPHHENEIAQSEAATGKPFARYWIHNGFVTVNKEKMSKSLGNFFTLKDILAKFPGPVVRLMLLSQHYKTPLDFSDELLSQAQSAYESLADIQDLAAFLLWKKTGSPEPKVSAADRVLERFRAVMDKDFHTEEALAVLFDLRKSLVELVKKGDAQGTALALSGLRTLAGVLGIVFPEPPYGKSQDAELEGAIREREDARRTKDWEKADKIRKDLESKNIAIEDTPYGTRWKKK